MAFVLAYTCDLSKLDCPSNKDLSAHEWFLLAAIVVVVFLSAQYWWRNRR